MDAYIVIQNKPMEYMQEGSGRDGSLSGIGIIIEEGNLEMVASRFVTPPVEYMGTIPTAPTRRRRW